MSWRGNILARAWYGVCNVGQKLTWWTGRSGLMLEGANMALVIVSWFWKRLCVMMGVFFVFASGPVEGRQRGFVVGVVLMCGCTGLLLLSDDLCGGYLDAVLMNVDYIPVNRQPTSLLTQSPGVNREN